MINTVIYNKFKVKCLPSWDLKDLGFTINKEYEASYHVSNTDYYIIKNDEGVVSPKPSYYFEPIDTEESNKIKDSIIKDLEYWNSIKKVVLVTKEYKNLKYNGAILGEVYDVIEYVANSAPSGRFRIKGKLDLDGRIDLFPKQLFITLEQHRQNQLEKIL